MKRFKFKFHLIVFSRAIILNMLRMGLGRGVGSVVIGSCISAVKTLKFKKTSDCLFKRFSTKSAKAGSRKGCGIYCESFKFQIQSDYHFKSYCLHISF